ncbi:UNVERIFIED_CONTAM: Carbonic anhydrase 7 [Gekko kuhli]
MTGHKCWGYGQKDGPSEWHTFYPIAQGNRQSPIDIDSKQAVFDPCLKPLRVSYELCTSLELSNNGHSVMVDFKDVDDKAVISGGPLEDPYRLKQFHFHWGKSRGCGSEHTIDGKSFPCEVKNAIPEWIQGFGSKALLHLVHWNARKYRTFGEAVEAPDGLAVVGIFLEIGKEHPGMSRLTDALYMVKYKFHSAAQEQSLCGFQELLNMQFAPLFSAHSPPPPQS